MEELLGREVGEVVAHLEQAGFRPEIKVTLSPRGEARGQQRVVRVRVLLEGRVEVLVVYDPVCLPGDADPQ
uniref:PASTA domain-containing protein n=1 Tax=Ammonifex degensii TaxID=42838 RepID=A0A7C1F2N7_9THEO